MERVSPIAVTLMNIAFVSAIAAGIIWSIRNRMRAWQIQEQEYRQRGLSLLPLAFRGVKSSAGIDLHTYITNQHVNRHQAERTIRVLMRDGLVHRIVDDETGTVSYILTDLGRKAIGKPARATGSPRQPDGEARPAGPMYIAGDYIASGGIKQQGDHSQINMWQVPTGADYMEQVRLLVQALHADADHAPGTVDAKQAREHAVDLDTAAQTGDRRAIDNAIGRVKSWAGAGQTILTLANSILDLFTRK